jgi:O-antigen ligase
MGVVVVDLATGLGALIMLYARPTVVLGLLITSMMLVPATLIAPHILTSYATVNHALVAAAGVRLAVMAKQGGWGRLFRATPLHLALALLVVTWVADGLAFAPPTGIPDVALERLLNLAFVAGFYVVCLALCRLIDNPSFVMRTLVVTFAISAVIAVLEHVSGRAYGETLFNFAHQPGTTTAAHVLETRAGHARVRSSAEFALAYAWLAVMLLPFITMAAMRTRRWWSGLPLLALTFAVVYWTYARSAAAAIPVVLVLVAIATRERRMFRLAGAGILVSAGLYLFDPAIRHHLSLHTDVGSVGVRFQRFPLILDAVSHHPFLGLGIGGLQTIGVPVTDNFYLYSYGDTGAVGAAILVAFCLVALIQAARGVRLTDPRRASVVAACLVGFVAFLVSGVIEDSLLLSQPAELAMLLLALATATSEPELGLAPMPRWSFRRVLFFGATGSVIGVGAFLLAPVTVSQQRQFSTVSPWRTIGRYDAVTSGRLLIATVCQVASDIQPSLRGVHITCLDDFGPAGVGTLRISSPTTRQTLGAYATLATTLRQVSYLAAFQTLPTGPPISARSSFWTTAPASGAAFGLAIGFIAPLPLRRRRPALRLPPPSAAAGPDPVEEEKSGLRRLRGGVVREHGGTTGGRHAKPPLRVPQHVG